MVDEPVEGNPVLMLAIYEGDTEFKALILGRGYIDHFCLKGDQVVVKSHSNIEYLPGVDRESALESRPSETDIY